MLTMYVTPLVGVWIEICMSEDSNPRICVTPLVGVWIEIKSSNSACPILSRSLPLWECGLKFYADKHTAQRYTVTPLVGVWIEIM